MENSQEGRLVAVLHSELKYLEDNHRHLMAALRANEVRARQILLVLGASATTMVENLTGGLPL